jgi:hypothetical protein
MNIPTRFWKWFDVYYGIEHDEIDVEALYDHAITLEENITLFKAQFPRGALRVVCDAKTATKTATETPPETTKISAQEKINLDKQTFVLIIGDRNSAKSNLMFFHANNYEGKKPKYLMGYPKKMEGFREVTSMQDLANLTDAVVFIDEIDKFFNVYDRRSNMELMEFLRIAAHTNLTIVGSSALPTFITKGMESMVDVWNITRLRDLASLKNGSKPKRVIQQTKHFACSSWSLSLPNGQYLQYGDGLGAELNGVKMFPNQNIPKVWGRK